MNQMFIHRISMLPSDRISEQLEKYAFHERRDEYEIHYYFEK